MAPHQKRDERELGGLCCRVNQRGRQRDAALEIDAGAGDQEAQQEDPPAVAAADQQDAQDQPFGEREDRGPARRNREKGVQLGDQNEGEREQRRAP